LPLAARVASYVAEGAEVLVATDHDVVTDYGPVIRELQLAARSRASSARRSPAASGRPKPPHGFGHANAFPLPDARSNRAAERSAARAGACAR